MGIYFADLSRSPYLPRPFEFAYNAVSGTSHSASISAHLRTVTFLLNTCRMTNQRLPPQIFLFRLTYPIFLLGDFSFPCMNWSTPAPFSTKGTRSCEAFLDACLGFNFSQLLCHPSKASNSYSFILDPLLITHSDHVPSPLTSFVGGSGHQAVYSVINRERLKPVRALKTIRLYEKGW